MKQMKKALAALLALTMAVGLSACGESSGDTADTGAESSAAESSDANAEESSEESSEETAEKSYEMEEHSTEHAPYGIKTDYAIPTIDKYKISTNTDNPHYFGIQAEDSYFYREDPKNEDAYGIDVYVTTRIYNKDDIQFQFYRSDDKIEGSTDNGYDLVYNTKETENDKGNIGNRLDVYMNIFSESYRDATIWTEVHVMTYESDMNTDELVDFAMAITNSVKITDYDENALQTDDGGYKIYPHKFTVPAKVTIAGNETDYQLITDMSYPEAFVEFDDNDIHYEINTDILTYNSLLWSKTKEKTDEYTPVTVAGHEAFAKLQTFGCNGEFVVYFDDTHVETVKIYAKSYADGSTNKDGKSFSDVQKEMIDDANKAATIAKMTEYVSAFVGAWTIDESVQEPK